MKIIDETAELRKHAMQLVSQSIQSVLPGENVRETLNSRTLGDRIHIIAVGKEAWIMAEAAIEVYDRSIHGGIVLTKYGHSQGPLPGMEILEAGHPVPDAASISATKKIINYAEGLSSDDVILFLLSGGGSSLFEKPLDSIGLEDIIDVSEQLLSCGADIEEINTVRKRLSSVKGGRFADLCGETPIFALLLSDVVNGKRDTIASGPVVPDESTASEALSIVEKYGLKVSKAVIETLRLDPPKTVSGVEVVVSGSVESLCKHAAEAAEGLGYAPYILTTSMNCEAQEAGRFLASIARRICSDTADFMCFKRPCAIISGGETVIRVQGTGKGGRNQELALAAAIDLKGMEHVVLASISSDGFDGLTEAAGGLVDGMTAERISRQGTEPEVFLDNNDAFYALQSSGDLIVTGPTGTNVNDLTFVLCSKS